MLVTDADKWFIVGNSYILTIGTNNYYVDMSDGSRILCDSIHDGLALSSRPYSHIYAKEISVVPVAENCSYSTVAWCGRNIKRKRDRRQRTHGPTWSVRRKPKRQRLTVRLSLLLNTNSITSEASISKNRISVSRGQPTICFVCRYFYHCWEVAFLATSKGLARTNLSSKPL